MNEDLMLSNKEYLMKKYEQYMSNAGIVSSPNYEHIKELYYMKPIKETDEDKVIRLIKGDFEKQFGMSFDKFQEILKKIIEETPEKLI